VTPGHLLRTGHPANNYTTLARLRMATAGREVTHNTGEAQEQLRWAQLPGWAPSATTAVGEVPGNIPASLTRRSEIVAETETPQELRLTAYVLIVYIESRIQRQAFVYSRIFNVSVRSAGGESCMSLGISAK
jgi:hypothetical protein